MAAVWQEMQCAKSGGGCGTYFAVHFEDSFTGKVGIRCGICKHPHTRCVVNGVLKEEGRYVGGLGDIKFEVEILASACYPDSRAAKMLAAQKKNKGVDIRDGMPEEESVLVRELDDAEKARRQIIMDSWYNKCQNEKFGS